MQCLCGCLAEVSSGKRYVSGHNLKNLERTKKHRQAIAEAQRRAWSTKRERLPVGSVWKDAGGYIRVKVVPGKGRWRLEHVLVMERVIGRRLNPGEVVHHINGVRDDNKEENLFLCHGHRQHIAIESSLLATFRRLLDAGIARFNRETASYEAILP